MTPKSKHPSNKTSYKIILLFHRHEPIITETPLPTSERFGHSFPSVSVSTIFPSWPTWPGDLRVINLYPAVIFPSPAFSSVCPSNLSISEFYNNPAPGTEFSTLFSFFLNFLFFFYSSIVYLPFFLPYFLSSLISSGHHILLSPVACPGATS